MILDDQYDYFQSYVKEYLTKDIDQILFIHLSRRLYGDNDNNGYSLIDVLTKKTSLSDYLKTYDLTFKYNQHINMYVNTKEVNIIDNKYLLDRFGYRFADYSFSGYAFGTHIEDIDYYNIALGGPEFFGYIYEYDIDDDAIIDNFIENSQFYLFEYKVSIKDIEFEGYDEFNDYEKMIHIVVIALQRLYFEKYDPIFNCHENQVIKMKDGKMLSEKYLISKTVL